MLHKTHNWYYYTSLTSHWFKLNHMTWNNFNVLWKLTQITTDNNICQYHSYLRWYQHKAFIFVAGVNKYSWTRTSEFILGFSHGSLVFCVVFCGVFVCLLVVFSFRHCIVCPSSFYSFLLPLGFLYTFFFSKNSTLKEANIRDVRNTINKHAFELSGVQYTNKYYNIV